jgi:class 3 adenylate cyclase/tetratricopeptide (TPR) repeat protein
VIKVRAVTSPRDVEAVLAGETLDARHLQEVWEARETVPWLQDAALARRFIERALEAGELLLACDAAAEASRLHADPGLRHDRARALLQLGSWDDAREAIRPLEALRGLTDRMRGRTLRLKGDVHFEEAGAQAARENHGAQLLAARDAYRAALALAPDDHEAAARLAIAQLLLARFELADEPAPATLPAVAAFEREASEAARRALALVEARLDKCERVDQQFDLVVARAEARCILGEFERAAGDYRAAVGLGPIRAHRLAAARRRARLIAGAKRALSRETIRESFYDACFPPLQLIVFSGHMLDAPERSRPRFPPAAEAAVREGIRAALERLQASVGFASAAAGGDLLFLEEMRRRDAQVHVVLPWARQAFVETSVARAGPPWVERFEAALAGAASVRVLGELSRPTDRVGYQYANSVMSGLARLTARALGLDLVPLALWDGQLGLAGGTADFVDFWRGQALLPEIVPLPPVDAGAAVAPPASAPGTPPPAARAAMDQQVKTMLFADIVGYSRLPEAVIPDFVREFMGGVSRVIAASPHAPISVNTWGDALYFVFDRVEAAGCFALELVEMIERTDWEARGVFWEDVVDGRVVRRPLRLRTALHAGPVFPHFDPVVRRLSFTGAHVSRAARIEPVTLPGDVFASEEFAALAAADNAGGFACHFVGTMPLAKKYPGVFRIYRLRRVQSFPVDRLGRLIHEAYCRERAALGDTPARNTALRAWDDLPADLQAANREQAADIPAKLRAIGYELVTAPRDLAVPGGALAPDDPGLLAALREHEERLSIGEHERWSQSRARAGWVRGPRDDAARRHPDLVPWDALDQRAKDKDRETVRSIPFLLRGAGFRVRRL